MRAPEETENTRRKNLMDEKLSERDFRNLSELIYDKCGIRMTQPKKIMLEARLRKRLRALNMTSLKEYCNYLFSPPGMQKELIQMLNVVTTNKTDFFRELRHFDFLTNTAVPELISFCGAGTKRNLMVWSAGCSTGEEPYTIAMVLNEYRETHPSFRFTILATDISTTVLEKAMRAVYHKERAETVPPALKRKYLMRNRDSEKPLVRVVPELRGIVRFRRLNFMESDFGMREPMDIIFCRNVIIYFDKPTQEKLINRLCNHLIPGGYIFMGHSETLSGLNAPLAPVGPMVYKKPL